MDYDLEEQDRGKDERALLGRTIDPLTCALRPISTRLNLDAFRCAVSRNCKHSLYCGIGELGHMIKFSESRTNGTVQTANIEETNGAYGSATKTMLGRKQHSIPTVPEFFEETMEVLLFGDELEEKRKKCGKGVRGRDDKWASHVLQSLPEASRLIRHEIYKLPVPARTISPVSDDQNCPNDSYQGDVLLTAPSIVSETVVLIKKSTNPKKKAFHQNNNSQKMVSNFSAITSQIIFTSEKIEEQAQHGLPFLDLLLEKRSQNRVMLSPKPPFHEDEEISRTLQGSDTELDDNAVGNRNYVVALGINKFFDIEDMSDKSCERTEKGTTKPTEVRAGFSEKWLARRKREWRLQRVLRMVSTVNTSRKATQVDMHNFTSPQMFDFFFDLTFAFLFAFPSPIVLSYHNTKRIYLKSYP